MKILIAASDLPDRERLGLLSEIGEIQEGVAPDLTTSDISVDLLARATLKSLQVRLAALRPNILHIVGHGETDYIVLHSDPGNGGDALTGELLAGTLKYFGSETQLAVLHSCWSAELVPPLLGVVKAVIGVPGLLGDDLAAKFSGQLYRFLARGVPLVEAFRLARSAVAHQNPNGAALPQLYPPELDPRLRLTRAHRRSRVAEQQLDESPEPALRARFLLRHGEPKYSDAYQGYWIKLWVKNASVNAAAAKYVLHRSYDDRLVPSNERPRFPIEITSYGDYTVRCVLTVDSDPPFLQTLRQRLSMMLRASHGRKPTRAVQKAIEDIDAN